MSGVASLIVVGGFVEDILVQLREGTIHSQYGHIQIYKAGYSIAGRRSPFQFMITDSDLIIHRLEGIAHVATITPRLNLSGLLSNGKTNLAVIGEGVDAEKERSISSFLKLVSGKSLSAELPYGILLGQGVANSLKLKVGDRATLLLSTVGGAFNTLDFEVVGIFQTFSKDFDDRAVRITIGAGQELLNTKAVHKLVLGLDDTAATETVAAKIRGILGLEHFEIKEWQQLADFYQSAVDLYRRYFIIFRIIILGMVLLGVANSVNLSIFQRTGEFGTLRAIGNRSGAIFRLLICEHFILAMLGSSAGVVLGAAIAWAVSQVGIPMPSMPNSNTAYNAQITLVPSEIVTAFAIGLAATLCAAILPALRATKLPVIEALRYN
jgi:putative ABC transport system permease protein